MNSNDSQIRQERDSLFKAKEDLSLQNADDHFNFERLSFFNLNKRNCAKACAAM
ncbi:hypothetical protein ACLBXI_20740 [Bacillus cereus]